MELHCEDRVVSGLQGGHIGIAARRKRGRGDLPEVHQEPVVAVAGQLEAHLVVEVKNSWLGGELRLQIGAEVAVKP